MEGFDNSENFGALISMCNSKEKKSWKNSYAYGREFQDMLDSLDEEDCLGEARQSPTEKKRRLSFEQVKALERSFDVCNKLEPERKLKLAQESGLQPRQVAIWFQNRRARCKTKQLEIDYDLLKANYDTLKLDFNNLEQEKAALTKELSNLKAKIGEENAQGSRDVKEEFPESAYLESQQSIIQDECSNHNQTGTNISSVIEDRSSNGDSNAVPVEVNNGNAQLLPSPIDPFHINGLSPSSVSMVNWFHTPTKSHHQYQFVKMLDQGLSSTEEPCNFFSVDQAPSLYWYLPQQ